MNRTHGRVLDSWRTRALEKVEKNADYVDDSVAASFDRSSHVGNCNHVVVS